MKHLFALAAVHANRWTNAAEVPGAAAGHVLQGVQVDDWAFGVSAVSAEGVESPVASAVAGGAFAPIVP